MKQSKALQIFDFLNKLNASFTYKYLSEGIATLKSQEPFVENILDDIASDFVVRCADYQIPDIDLFKIYNQHINLYEDHFSYEFCNKLCRECSHCTSERCGAVYEHVFLYSLLSAIYRCISNEEKQNELKNKLLQVRPKACLRAAVLWDNVHFITTHEDLCDTDLRKNLFLAACRYGKKSVAGHLIIAIDQWTKGNGLVLVGTFHQKDIIKLYHDKDIPLHLQNDDGDTLLHCLARGKEDFFNYLWDNFVWTKKDLGIKNNKNQTVFYVASYSNRNILRLKNLTNRFLLLGVDPLSEELKKAVFVYESSRLNDFINYCIEEGADLNRRYPIDCKRVVDIAQEEYLKATRNSCWDSDYFINKEKIMHAFMDKTEYIKDKEVVKIFLSHFPKDIIGRVLHYYHAVNVDYLVAKNVIAQNDNQYYAKTKQQKEQYKTEVIMQANAVMNALLCKPKEIQ